MSKCNNILFSPILNRQFLSLSDQCLLSAFNFTINIFLLKNVSQSQFGFHTIAFTVMLFFISIQNALVTTPMSILLYTKQADAKQNYLNSLFNGQLIISLIVAVISYIFIMIIGNHHLISKYKYLIICLNFTIVGFLLREFIRCCYFAKEIPFEVLRADILYISIYGVTILIIYHFFELSIYYNFITLGTSAIIIVLIHHKRLHLKLTTYDIKNSYRQNWKYGKWALLGVTVTHLQTNSYLYLIAAIVGSVATAEISAARMLLMPLILLQESWHKVAIPNGSRLREEHKIKEFFFQQIGFSVAIVVIALIYVSLLFLFALPLQHYLLTSKYNNSFNYLYFFGLIIAMRCILSNASYGLQVLKHFRYLATINSITMIITLTLSYLFMLKYSTIGALIGLIIGNTLMAIMLWIKFFFMVFIKNPKASIR